MFTRTLLTGAVALFAVAAVLSIPRPAEALANPAAEGRAFTIDLDHSSVNFDIEHYKVSRSWGRFNSFSGEFTFGDEPADMSVELTIKTESIDTNNAKRDEHLRSADFFNSRQFPEMKFVSSKVAANGDGGFDLTGEMTMLGTTETITAKLVEVGRVDNADGGVLIGFTATFAINRMDFGMETYPEALGHVVNVRVDIEASSK